MFCNISIILCNKSLKLSLYTYLKPIMYDLRNDSFHIFSLQNKYHRIFLSNMENTATKYMGKSFKKARNSSSLISEELTTVFKSPWNLIVQQKGYTCVHILPLCKNHWPSEHRLCRKVVSIFRAKWHMFIVQVEPILMVDSAASIK
jgi:hypothetical protein